MSAKLRKDWETYKFEDFLYSLEADAADAIAIIFLGPYQMRMEQGITSFRTLMEQKYSPCQYYVYSLLDEPDIKYRRVEKHKSNGLAISELAEYERKKNNEKVYIFFFVLDFLAHLKYNHYHKLISLFY